MDLNSQATLNRQETGKRSTKRRKPRPQSGNSFYDFKREITGQAEEDSEDD